MFQAFPPILPPQIILPPCIWDATKIGGNGVVSGNVFEVDNSGIGSVIGTVGLHAGKHYFEVFVGTPYYLKPPQVPSFSLVPHAAAGITQAPNLVSPFTFGGSGHGCQLDDTGTLKDADTFGSIANYTLPFTATIMPPAGQVYTQHAVDLDNWLYWGGYGGKMVGDPAAGTGGKPIAPGTYFPCVAFPYTGTWFNGQFYAAGFFPTNSTFYKAPTGFSQWR
jgi:hypothetical protein